MTRKRELAPMAGAIAAAFCMAMSGPAIGQGTASQGAATGANATNAQQQRGTAQHGQQQANMKDIRASRLMGRNLRTSQGQDIGEVTDLVVDMSSGRVHYAIVEHGGVLGIGDEARAIPLSRLQANARGNEFRLNMTEQQLKDAPKLESKAKWSDPRTWDNLGQYYTRTLGMAPSDRPSATGSSRTQASGARFQQASDVIGMEVIDPSGKEVGEVEDLVVNLSNGSIHYAVLEFDREWNPDDKLVALPASSLQPSRGRDELTINRTQEQIANAPSFDSRNWPDMNDRAFRDRVAGFGHDGTTGMDRSNAQAGASPASSNYSTPGAAGTTGQDKQSRTGTTSSSSVTPGGGAATGMDDQLKGSATPADADRSAAGATPTLTTIVIIDDPQFTRLDTDRDGRLSRDEAKAFSRLTENWDVADRNHDGYLTRDELDARMSGGTSASRSGTASSSGNSSSASSRSSQTTGSSGGTTR